MARIRVGTCSWTDPTMVRAWYPPSERTAADRLRYYAGHFDTVEVDSSYYGMPTPATARLWVERTPPGFVFHVKAFGMLTRHGVKPEQLPPPLREGHTFELDRGGRILHPPRALREDAFALFGEALEPLRDAGKLGMILMQFPPYFVDNEANREYIVWSTERLAPDRVAVEFRHNSWVQPDVLEDTLGLLESLGRLVRVRGRAPHADRQRLAAHRSGHVGYRLRALQRTQRRHLERAGAHGGGALPLPLRRRASWPSGWSQSTDWGSRHRPPT